MNYNELCELAQQGRIGKLPNFVGYFYWSYKANELIFHNGNFECKAKDLDIQNRTDFYYII